MSRIDASMTTNNNNNKDVTIKVIKEEQPNPPHRALYTEVKIFGRPLPDYLAMFSLDDSLLHEWVQLNYSVLDSNAGPASFASQAYENYSLAITCADPCYSLNPAAIKKVSERDIEELFANLHDVRNPDGALMFSAKYWSDKFDALTSFIADFERLREIRYIACRLPDLPFETRSFDVVLSSHFLFAYSPFSSGGIIDDRDATKLDDSQKFDLHFHLRAMDELARVCKREMRIFPVSCIGNWAVEAKAVSDGSDELGANWHPYLSACIERLQDIGFETKVLETAYYKGGKLLIAVRH